MSEKRINGRIVLKHDVESNWKLAIGFTPMTGEIIIYDVDENYSYERLKIGDGVHNVNDLPFVDDIVALTGTAENPVILADLEYGMYSLDGRFKHFESDENLGTYKKAMIFVQEVIVNMKNIFVFTGSGLVNFTLNIKTNAVIQRNFLNDESINTLNIASLTTENKTITGAINELKTNMGTQFEHVNGLIGDKSVSEQIAAANMIHVGPDMPTDPNIKVWINTAEEGTGIVPVLPRVSTISLDASAWVGSSAPYSQVVTINTVTSATKVELNPTVAQIVSLQSEDIALTAENNNGVITVYSFGGKPSTDMTIQVTLMEVSYV